MPRRSATWPSGRPIELVGSLPGTSASRSPAWCCQPEFRPKRPGGSLSRPEHRPAPWSADGAIGNITFSQADSAAAPQHRSSPMSSHQGYDMDKWGIVLQSISLPWSTGSPLSDVGFAGPMCQRDECAAAGVAATPCRFSAPVLLRLCSCCSSSLHFRFAIDALFEYVRSHTDAKKPARGKDKVCNDAEDNWADKSAGLCAMSRVLCYPV